MLWNTIILSNYLQAIVNFILQNFTSSVMKKIIFFSLVIFSISSCYYNDKEELGATTSGTCDTSAVKYSTTVKTILDASCNSSSCHGSSSGRDIILDSYAEVKKYVDDGSLLGSIQHDAKYSAMPQGGSKLSDCYISQIKAWIDAGALNN